MRITTPISLAGKSRPRVRSARAWLTLAPLVTTVLFAAAAQSISIPSVKARVQPAAASAPVAKNQPLAASANAGENPFVQNGPAPALTGKRDPFRLPSPLPPPGKTSRLALKPGSGVDLPPGAAGLLIDQLRLQGTVSEDAGHRMIAIVTNDTNRSYFLQPDEAVFDGVVTKIAPDTICFRQRLKGTHGGQSFREVVKRLSPRESQ